MKSIIVASVILFSGLANPAFAVCGTGVSYLTQAEIESLLSSKYACGRSTADPPGWNELHGAGSNSSVTEQHYGDINNPPEVVGTWFTSNTTTVITGSNTRGRVTYNYGSISPVYEVANNGTGACGGSACTLAGTYQFCGVGGAPTLTIAISTTVNSLTTCPSN